MTGRFEPNCKCGKYPIPQVNHLQVDKTPYDIEFILICRKCRKRWKETRLVYVEEKK